MQTNGCGPEKWPLWVKELLFNWFFEASCNKHDGGYQEGGNEARRKECDAKFLAAMLRDSKRLPLLLQPLAVAEAYIFYLIVRKFGAKSFNYTNKD